MDITLDDKNQRIYGKQTVTYKNNSPDQLTYLWVQLDQNMRAKDSDTKLIETGSINEKMSFKQVADIHNEFDGGFKLDYVKDVSGNDLPITVNKTMMRIDLPKPLMPGSSYTFKIKWWYNINDRDEIGGRSGYEYFEEEKNVAEKAPVDGILINDLNLKKSKKKIKRNKDFSYSIKVADFYYKDTAQMMLKRIKDEVLIQDLKNGGEYIITTATAKKYFGKGESA